MSSSVVFAIPSKKPAPEAQACIDKWRARGYRTVIWRDEGDEEVGCDLLLVGEYPGYARAVNALCCEVLARFPETEWIVTGGDDTDPDPTHPPESIASECTEHFGGTFGVMQPTGDRWGEDRSQRNFRGSAYIDKVAGSPWIGAEFCRRMYGGQGPYWPGWFHMHLDQEVQAVATKLGVFWQRPDLTHFHRHWGRTTGRCPDYMRKANAGFNESARLFAEREAAGFPGHEPIP